MTPSDDLVVSLRRAAHGLAAERSVRDLPQTLAHIVLAAVETVPHVDAGGISLAEDGAVTSHGPSDGTVIRLDRLQSRLDEGPCVAAIEEPSPDGTVVAHDLAGEDAPRWPRFAPEAVMAGYRSILSIQLTTDGGVRGALNLYSGEARVFDAATRRTAGLFGVQAAMLLHGSEQARRLQRAVGSSDLIGQAKGILMERFTVDEGDAFRMLVSSSRDTDTTVLDVAERLRGEARRRAGQEATVAQGPHDAAHEKAQRQVERATWGDDGEG